ncbi:uncharacterized protein YALI1_D11114g [Yarrowia lipolytica]|uniref:Uncharacterized protein n=1 Tax=Yarrowia lipolytica TaxID=4952 RepID=A0A1D8NDV3_YARLL|nr:hypothetical protein YALI1_D11114g [Yarrowia lipolytica]
MALAEPGRRRNQGAGRTKAPWEETALVSPKATYRRHAETKQRKKNAYKSAVSVADRGRPGDSGVNARVDQKPRLTVDMIRGYLLEGPSGEDAMSLKECHRKSPNVTAFCV